jgi:short-subunit dehydrogenase
MRRTIAGSRAIVTGASGGLGRAIATELARQGANLVLVARRADQLRAVADEISQTGGRATVVAGDITDPQIRQQAIAKAQTEFGGLDLLVNNAGVGAIGRFDAADEARLRRVFEINFFAAAELTRAAIPMLRLGRQPIIVNIGSVLGLRATPQNSEYCASKFALRGWSESIRIELASDGIDVLLVSLGPTQSDFWDHLVGQNKAPPWSTSGAMPTELAASKIVRAVEAGRRELIPSFKARWFVRAGRLFPGLMDRFMRRYG